MIYSFIVELWKKENKGKYKSCRHYLKGEKRVKERESE